VRDLGPTERQKVEELSHRTADATIKTRCQIIVLEASSMSVPQIAQVIFYREDTVARCIHEFHQSRWVSLLPSPREDARAIRHAGLLAAAALDHRARSQASSLSFLDTCRLPCWQRTWPRRRRFAWMKVAFVMTCMRIPRSCFGLC
jgi:hypothetical protein